MPGSAGQGPAWPGRRSTPGLACSPHRALGQPAMATAAACWTLPTRLLDTARHVHARLHWAWPAQHPWACRLRAQGDDALARPAMVPAPAISFRPAGCHACGGRGGPWRRSACAPATATSAGLLKLSRAQGDEAFGAAGNGKNGGLLDTANTERGLLNTAQHEQMQGPGHPTQGAGFDGVEARPARCALCLRTQHSARSLSKAFA